MIELSDGSQKFVDVINDYEAKIEAELLKTS